MSLSKPHSCIQSYWASEFQNVVPILMSAKRLMTSRLRREVMAMVARSARHVAKSLSHRAARITFGSPTRSD